MKATKFYTIFMLMLLFLVSCQQKETEFRTNSQDYDQFLASEPVKTTSKYFDLWDNKIKSDSLQLLSLGECGR
jgi:hypothetical protein